MHLFCSAESNEYDDGPDNDNGSLISTPCVRNEIKLWDLIERQSNLLAPNVAPAAE